MTMELLELVFHNQGMQPIWGKTEEEGKPFKMKT